MYTKYEKVFMKNNIKNKIIRTSICSFCKYGDASICRLIPCLRVSSQALWDCWILVKHDQENEDPAIILKKIKNYKSKIKLSFYINIALWNTLIYIFAYRWHMTKFKWKCRQRSEIGCKRMTKVHIQLLDSSSNQ